MIAQLSREPIGFRCRRNDGLGEWSYVYHREPDDFERKHLVIERIFAEAPAPVAYDQAQRDMMKNIMVNRLSANIFRGDKLEMDDIHAVTMALTEAGFRATPPAPVAVPDEFVIPEVATLTNIERLCPLDVNLSQTDFATGWNECRQFALANNAIPPVVNGISAYCQGWNACRAAMQAEPVSTAYKLPDGWKLVPVEPTEAMMLHKSGCQHHAWDDADCAMRQTRRLVWAHMLAAAPAAPDQKV